MKIAVIGLGAIGAQIFWNLARTPGIDVVGFESAYVGHPFAGAGGESRLYRNLEVGDLDYVPVIRRAQQLWNELAAEADRSVRRLTGVLFIGDPGNPQVANALESAAMLDAPHETLTARDIVERFPQLSPRSDEIGIWDTDAGVIDPAATVTTAVARGVAHGGDVREYTRIDHLESRESGVRLHTARGFLDFDRAVVACGGWTTKLVPELRDFVVSKRLTSAWFAGTADTTLCGLPPFMRAAPHYCYGIPTTDGLTVKLGLGFNDHFSTADPDTVERDLRGDAARTEIDRFNRKFADLLPTLQPNPVRLDTYIESYTRTMHEHVRLHPDDSNIAVLTGFSGHGFKISPAIGEAGAQLISSGCTDLDLEFLTRATPLFDIEDVSTGTTSHNPLTSSTPI